MLNKQATFGELLYDFDEEKEDWFEQCREQIIEDKSSATYTSNINSSSSIDVGVRRFRGLLNKITAENFEKLSLDTFNLIQVYQEDQNYLDTISSLIIYHVNRLS